MPTKRPLRNLARTITVLAAGALLPLPVTQLPAKPLSANAAAAQDQTQAGPSVRPHGTTTVTNFTSRNWSGYFTTNAAHTTDFRSVHARWIQPKVTCPANKDAWVVSWVGMDGWWNDVVEQGGSSARCVNGVPQYALWWEMFPHNDIQLANPVKPGDLIDASVTYEAAAKKFRIVVKDQTTGQTLIQVQPCYPDMGGCPRVNAEVITETPLGGSAGDGVFFLPNYGAVRYDQVSVTDTGGHVGSLDNPHWDLGHVNQVSPTSGVTKQNALALGPRGASFSTVWVHE
ncbi:G1 family glutamic endopeptidase [Amycolatopsis sp. cg13]|uniref:G1 family glutamic endopeptidase n=1 Tax=Amycolatopsis sp. cg13 TaxID=3238807 RepID=UPI003524ECCA